MAPGRRLRTSDRYLDPEDAFQKVPKPAAGFASTFIFQHIKELIRMSFSQILQLLQDELKSNTIFKLTWINAEARFRILKKTLEAKNRGMEKLPDECHIAIIAYTMETGLPSSLYEDFNQKCRGLVDGNSWRNFPYKAYFALLARSIHGVRNSPDVTTDVYYRGIGHRINYLKEGDYVFPAQFLSCSIDEDIARDFMGGAQNHGTLIRFRGSPLAACGIVAYSDFPDEEEMLVFPWSTFKVAEIKRGAQEDRVLLESVGPCVKDLPYSGKYVGKGARVNNS